jgi:hypothetical protein
MQIRCGHGRLVLVCHLLFDACSTCLWQAVLILQLADGISQLV